MLKIFALMGTTIVIAMAAHDAQASADLAKAKNCLACHATTIKIVGPSFKDVAAKYRAEPGAVAQLAQKIQKGSQGVWGAIPMPPNGQVNKDEAVSLAQWIMTVK